MSRAVNHLLRGLCLVVYAIAILKLAGLLPAGVFDHTPWVAVALLGLHAAELAFAFRHVRRYRGSLAASILLTLLFGLLHWKPLADQQASTRG